MVAWFGWASSARAIEYAEPRLCVHDDGWTWIAQTEQDVCAWVRLDSRPGAGRRFLLPKSLTGFHALGRERGADVTRRIVEKQGGERYFYAGDAGALLDPASGHGVIRALMSGMAAANHAARIIQQACPAQLELSAYERWVRAAFRREVKMLERFEIIKRRHQLNAPVRVVPEFA
jgi:flavin-dependent dehydrogenase